MARRGVMQTRAWFPLCPCAGWSPATFSVQASLTWSRAGTASSAQGRPEGQARGPFASLCQREEATWRLLRWRLGYQVCGAHLLGVVGVSKGTRKERGRDSSQSRSRSRGSAEPWARISVASWVGDRGDIAFFLLLQGLQRQAPTRPLPSPSLRISAVEGSATFF